MRDRSSHNDTPVPVSEFLEAWTNEFGTPIDPTAPTRAQRATFDAWKAANTRDDAPVFLKASRVRILELIRWFERNDPGGAPPEPFAEQPLEEWRADRP